MTNETIPFHCSLKTNRIFEEEDPKANSSPAKTKKRFILYSPYEIERVRILVDKSILIDFDWYWFIRRLHRYNCNVTVIRRRNLPQRYVSDIRILLRTKTHTRDERIFSSRPACSVVYVQVHTHICIFIHVYFRLLSIPLWSSIRGGVMLERCLRSVFCLLTTR